MSVVRGLEVENEESGDSAQETQLHPGAVCLAPYQHGVYQAVVIASSKEKEELLKLKKKEESSSKTIASKASATDCK